MTTASIDTLPRVVCVMGATASGKTQLAIDLAERLDAEIVSADSMQIYREFDIGTCKPTPAQLARVRHHLVSVLDPFSPCDAGRFVELADAAIADIRDRGRRVLVVGGTGLYFRALLHGLAPLPPTDPAIRRQIAEQEAASGLQPLYEQLCRIDPASAARLQPGDRQRITRALEVFVQTGRPLSQVQQEHRFRLQRYQALELAIDWPRSELYRRIDERAQWLFANGLIDECRRLRSAGYPLSLRPMQALGYKEIYSFLAGQCSDDEALQSVQRIHRRYAKRQQTWFRANPDICWLGPDDPDRAWRLAREHFRQP